MSVSDRWKSSLNLAKDVNLRGVYRYLLFPHSLSLLIFIQVL
jgi:hypothetical protein